MPRSSVEMPSPLDAANGYKLALENAQRHIHSAEVLSQANEHGVATAHLVLSAEEAIKSMLLFLVSEGLEVPIGALSSLLTQHQPRHITGALMTVTNLFFTKWFNLIKFLNEEYPDTTSSEYKLARRKKVEELNIELGKLENAGPGENHFIDSIAWWGNSNKLKQRGLYVDFSESSWLGPYSITKEEFDTSLEIAKDAIKSTERMIQTITSEDPSEREELAKKLNQFMKQRRAG